MKKYIIPYILGIITVGLISFQAGTETVMVVKPAKPISTIFVRSTWNDSNRNGWIKYIQQGYQIHSVTQGDNATETIVLVKY